MNDIPTITAVNPAVFDTGQTHHRWLHLTDDALGRPIAIPLIIVVGAKPGPTLGLVSTIHGDEVNGIPAIHRLLADLDPAELRGTVLAAPVLNVPGFKTYQRYFSDRADLNRVMPGNAHGRASHAYAHRLVEQVLKKCDAILDLHTASHGRINTHYVRADMENEATAVLARRQNAAIILHKTMDDTLRATATELGIPTVTVELGNPGVFQEEMIVAGVVGMRNTLVHLNMIDERPQKTDDPAVECDESGWVYTSRGGLLYTLVALGEMVSVDQPVAHLTNVFGDRIATYYAPHDGIVIGKSVNPVSQTGGRVVHVGRVKA